MDEDVNPIKNIIEATNERKFMIIGMCILISVAFYMGKAQAEEQTIAKQCNALFDRIMYTIPYNLTVLPMNYTNFLKNDTYRQQFRTT